MCYAMDIQMYPAIIRQKIDHVCIVYGSANGSLLQSIDVVANATIQIATGTFKPLKVPVAICIASSLPVCKC